MTVLRFPASAAVGMLWWPGASGELPAIGTVEVPAGTAVRLTVGRIPHSRKNRSRYGSNRRAVNLEFIRGLPAGSVCDLSLRGVVPASFAAVAHLAPGLRGLGVYIDHLGAAGATPSTACGNCAACRSCGTCTSSEQA